MVVENRDCVAQRLDALLRAVSDDASLLKQGSLQPSYRYRDGRKTGPYWRLVYREKGRQRSLYLGRRSEVVEAARRILAERQAPGKKERQRRRDDARRSRVMRSLKKNLEAELHKVGLAMKGFEIRRLRRRESFLKSRHEEIELHGNPTTG